MKRSFKKLALNRETIARLSQETLGMVAGASGATCPMVATCDATCATLCLVCPPSGADVSICISACDTCRTAC